MLHYNPGTSAAFQYRGGGRREVKFRKMWGSPSPRNFLKTCCSKGVSPVHAPGTHLVNGLILAQDNQLNLVNKGLQAVIIIKQNSDSSTGTA